LTRATLDDIATRVGVDKSTVSFTLRNHHRAKRFSQSTRERILAVADELNYRPNFFASHLRRSDRRVVMLCLSFLQDAYCAAIGEAFEQTLVARGYRMFVSVFQDRVDPHAFDREILGQHGVAGMAVVGSTRTKLSDESLVSLADEGVKIIMVGRDIRHASISRVLVDDIHGAEEAAAYLHQQGARRLWVMAGPSVVSPESVSAIRYQAVKAYAQRHQLPEPLLVDCGQDRLSLRHAVEAAVAKHGTPQGVIAVTDKLAYGTTQVFTDLGMKVGRDLGVVGYDDIWPSAWMAPALTTVRQPMEEMGRLAATMLMDTLEEKINLGRAVTLTPELVVRDSGVVQASPSTQPQQVTSRIVG